LQAIKKLELSKVEMKKIPIVLVALLSQEQKIRVCGEKQTDHI